MEALLHALSIYGENSRWIREYYEELKKTFKDEWIAVMDGKVIDHDKDLVKLVERLRKKYPKKYEQIAVEFIESKEVELIL